MQVKFDLARILTQRREAPGAIEDLERPVGERHINAGRTFLSITRVEELLDPFEMNMDLGIEQRIGLLEHLHAATPRQKLGIVLHAGDQIVHLFGRVAEQDGFMDVCHVFGLQGTSGLGRGRGVC